MSSQKSGTRSSRHFSVEQPFDLPGLKGLVIAKARVESNEGGCKQTVSYRCFGRRVSIKATSLIKGESTYTNVPPRDSLTMRGKKWTHVGETASGSSKWVNGSADVQRTPASNVEVVIDVLADRPRTGDVRSRTVYMPIG